MKVNRQARQASRKLFRTCFVDGLFNEERFRAVMGGLMKVHPRSVGAILHRLKVLVEIEIARRTFAIESAVEIPDKGASIFDNLSKKFGKPLATRYHVDPELLGGVVVRVGSNVWDGSVRGRLRNLVSQS